MGTLDATDDRMEGSMELLFLLVPALYIATIIFVIVLLYRMTNAVERIAAHLERKG